MTITVVKLNDYAIEWTRTVTGCEIIRAESAEHAKLIFNKFSADELTEWSNTDDLEIEGDPVLLPTEGDGS